MSDFLADKRREIKARLDELRPLVEEYSKLEAAEKALAGVSGAAASTARKAAGRAPAKRRGSTGTGKRGRPKGSGNRAAQALALITERPGITIPEIAEALKIKQNYLYRVVPGLADDGKIVKSGKGWHVKK